MSHASTDHNGNQEPSSHPTSTSNLQQTWVEFKQALTSNQDFSAFYWIYRLLYAALDIIVPCRVESRREKMHLLGSWCRPIIPALGMVLTILCSWSYYSTFRESVVMNRWCGCEKEGVSNETGNTGNACAGGKFCYWFYVHNFLVIFFTCNIIVHYTWCTFASPGIALSSNQTTARNFVPAKSTHELTKRSCQCGGTAPCVFCEPKNNTNKQISPSELKIGGCCFMTCRLSSNAENKRCLKYNVENSISTRTGSTENQSTIYHPTPDPTYCHKCQMQRPPRAQ